MSERSEPFKVLDLFSGIGGFSLGLERAGMQTIAFCEIDKKAQLVLKKHWPDVKIYDDVSTLKGEDIGTVDVICGGFPCQDISTAGKGAGLAGERSGLWYEFHRLIKEIQPKYAIIENVSALRSRGLDEVLRSLFEIGYDAEWHCIPASAIGAPHQRDRIWIVSYPNHQRESVSTINDEAPRMPKPSRNGLADSLFAGLERQCLSSRIQQELDQASRDYWRENSPEFIRVVDGVPNRMDRIKQLGNAVVPQIPELIGKAIINYENNRS